MTKEEALKRLKVLAKDLGGYKPNEDMFELAIEALEKQMPKKVRIEQHPKYGRATFCPNCNRMDVEGWSYCPACGMALDWSTK